MTSFPVCNNWANSTSDLERRMTPTIVWATVPPAEQNRLFYRHRGQEVYTICDCLGYDITSGVEQSLPSPPVVFPKITGTDREARTRTESAGLVQLGAGVRSVHYCDLYLYRRVFAGCHSNQKPSAGPAAEEGADFLSDLRPTVPLHLRRNETIWPIVDITVLSSVESGRWRDRDTAITELIGKLTIEAKISARQANSERANLFVNKYKVAPTAITESDSKLIVDHYILGNRSCISLCPPPPGCHVQLLSEVSSLDGTALLIYCLSSEPRGANNKPREALSHPRMQLQGQYGKLQKDEEVRSSFQLTVGPTVPGNTPQ
ncbi:hypothetical protein J6590_022891 [Homalodisca vitripennis]|nr:hypothetical protein J6590_022891 [Homalodisca vitripennis]